MRLDPETGDARLFGLPPGVDFPQALVRGLETRLEGAAPEDWARVTLIVNTNRMARRLRDLFDAGPARLLPRILLVTDLARLLPEPLPKSHRTDLRRKLDLMSLVRKLVETQSHFALHGALFDLTSSLTDLFDEMEAEGVPPEVISTLDVTDESGHWARTQAFIGIARQYLDTLEGARDTAAQARAIMDGLSAHWAEAPPPGPIILAGSTGSRGAVLSLMQAILKLPQGAVVLPGFDFEMPGHGWAAMSSQDHPQYRFLALARALGQKRPLVTAWDKTPPPSALRNRVVSLALRPAPATDAWLEEGPSLGPLGAALDNVTVLEAESTRQEAQAIALRLRQAAEDGQSAALVSPDRMLTRQVTAALEQWDLLPDDSAGTPLQLTPPGRFLRHTAQLFTRKLDAEALLTLLKHPLTASSEARGQHLRNLQALELRIRDVGMPYPDATGLARLADDEGWAAWLGHTLCQQERPEETRALSQWITDHLRIAEDLASGPGGAPSGLWQQRAGIAAKLVMDRLSAESQTEILMPARDYVDLISGLMAGEEVRDRDAPHPGIMIWGTIEARVQGADLVILGGMNDGTWPQSPTPDP